MNISFDGIVSNTFNTLPMAAAAVGENQEPGSLAKRRNHHGEPSQNKRVRRGDRQRPQSTSTSSAVLMSDESMSATTLMTNDSIMDGDHARQREGSVPMMSDDSFSSTTSLDELAETLRECTQNSYSFLDVSGTSHTGRATSTRLAVMSDFSQSSIGGGTVLSSTRGVSNTSPLVSFTRIRRDGPDRL